MRPPLPFLHRRRATRGYLLFEVMIAVTVFAFAVVGLIQALGGGLQSSTYQEKDRQLRFALQSHIAMMRTRQVLIGENTYPVDNSPFEVVERVDPLEATVETKQAGTVNLDKLYVVHLTCRQTGQTKGDAMEEEVYVYQP